jgi:putative transposase
LKRFSPDLPHLYLRGKSFVFRLVIPAHLRGLAGKSEFKISLKTKDRLYKQEKLAVRKRGGRKRALGTRRPIVLPSRANERWSLDFISDAFTDGRRFRVLAVVDDFTRECLALVPDTSLSGLRLARELNNLIGQLGKPRTIVSDNGTEMTSIAILKRCQETGIDWHRMA